MTEFQTAVLMFLTGLIVTIATTIVIIKGHLDTKKFLRNQDFFENEQSVKKEI